MNRQKHSHYHGVFSCGSKWTAEIKYKHLHKKMGLYDSSRLAALGYDAGVCRFHLQDVLPLNFPPEPELALFKTIFGPPLGLGTLALAIRRARAARGNIKRIPMNPELLFVRAMIRPIQLLFAVKGEDAPVCLKMAAGVGRGSFPEEAKEYEGRRLAGTNRSLSWLLLLN